MPHDKDETDPMLPTVGSASLTDRVTALENRFAAHKQTRNSKDDAFNSELEMLSEKVAAHDEQLRQLKATGESTAASLAEIKQLLAGAFGSDGLVTRVKKLEEGFNGITIKVASAAVGISVLLWFVTNHKAIWP